MADRSRLGFSIGPHASVSTQSAQKYALRALNYDCYLIKIQLQFLAQLGVKLNSFLGILIIYLNRTGESLFDAYIVHINK